MSDLIVGDHLEEPARKRARRNAICWNHDSEEAEAVRDAIFVIEMEHVQVAEQDDSKDEGEDKASESEADNDSKEPEIDTTHNEFVNLAVDNTTTELQPNADNIESSNDGNSDVNVVRTDRSIGKENVTILLVPRQ
jgi:hypothetical protein